MLSTTLYEQRLDDNQRALDAYRYTMAASPVNFYCSSSSNPSHFSKSEFKFEII